MKYYLDFKSDNFGKKAIDEPFGASDINFSLNQKPNLMGRDISFSGGEIEFEFTDMRNHYLKKLLYYHRKFGFEAVVVLTIEIDENNKYTCDLDFAKAQTDDLKYFKCKGIEDGKLQIIKARKAVKVDVLSDVDIDGNYIGGLVPENMLLLAKPIVQNSEWQQPTELNLTMTAKVLNASTKYFQINPCQNLIKSEIEDSYTFFESSNNYENEPQNNNLVLIKAKNNLKNIQLSIENIDLYFNTDVDNGGNGYADFVLLFLLIILLFQSIPKPLFL